MPALLLLLVPMLSTLLGGLLAMRFRMHADLLIGLGAGLLLGATFLDVLPEALALGVSVSVSLQDLLGFTLLSFLLFYGASVGASALEDRVTGARGNDWGRRAGLGLFVFHSFRDGVAIGAAYAASHSAGYAVAFGIAAHDLGDGMNTVLLTMRGGPPDRAAYGWLLADAVAPVLGGLLTFWWLVSLRDSVALLLLTAGFFLQVATGDFLTHVRQHGRSRGAVLAAVGLGALVIFLGNHLVGIH